jgi:Cu/Ag efflux protein CusF
MKRGAIRIFAAAGALALGACGAKETVPAQTAAAPAPAAAAAPAPTPVLSGTLAENTITANATVKAIDQKTRMVTLKGPDGKTQTIQVDESVKNLPQVKKGDQVIVTYYESLAYNVVREAGVKRGVTMAEQLNTAQPGEMPAAVGARAVTVTAKIKAIDKTNGTVTLKGPKGNMETVKVRDPSKLDKVKVGDHVQLTYTQALAISVEEAPKKTSKK